jgi:hypothetical protein
MVQEDITGEGLCPNFPKRAMTAGANRFYSAQSIFFITQL